MDGYPLYLKHSVGGGLSTCIATGMDCIGAVYNLCMSRLATVGNPMALNLITSLISILKSLNLHSFAPSSTYPSCFQAYVQAYSEEVTCPQKLYEQVISMPDWARRLQPAYLLAVELR